MGGTLTSSETLVMVGWLVLCSGINLRVSSFRSHTVKRDVIFEDGIRTRRERACVVALMEALCRFVIGVHPGGEGKGGGGARGAGIPSSSNN